MNTEAAAPEAQLDLRYLSAHVRVPNHIVHRSFPQETVVLNLTSGTYHGLNHTGGRMLAALEQHGHVATVAIELAAEFEVPLGELQADLCFFCDDLLKRGIIELAEPRSA